MKKTAMVWSMAGCVVLAGLWAGCGKAGTEAVEATGAALAAVVKSPAEEARDAAEGAVSALQEGRLDKLYGALPESWQGDVSRVVAAYAGKVDPELARAASDVLAAAGRALEAQAGNFAALALKAGKERAWDPTGALEGVPEEEMSKAFREAGAVLKACGEWLSAEKLAKGDLSGVLGSSALREGVKALAADADVWPVALVRMGVRGAEQEEDGDGVSLMVGSDEDGWDRVTMRKVEGRWVPEELAEAWRGAMDTALAKAAEFEIPAEDAARARQFLPMVKQMADGLAGAKSADELESQLQGIMMGAVMMMGFSMN